MTDTDEWVALVPEAVGTVLLLSLGPMLLSAVADMAALYWPPAGFSDMQVLLLASVLGVGYVLLMAYLLLWFGERVIHVRNCGREVSE